MQNKCWNEPTYTYMYICTGWRNEGGQFKKIKQINFIQIIYMEYKIKHNSFIFYLAF